MGMSPRIKAKKGRFGTGGLPPVISILTPADGYAATSGVGFAATATAVDPEGGDISANIVWTSDIDGSVGTNGGSTTLTLTTIGTHVITATVSDGTNTVTDTINVTVA